MAGPSIESSSGAQHPSRALGELTAPAPENLSEPVPPFVIFLSQEECAQRVNHQALMNYIAGGLRIAGRLAEEPGDPLTVRVYLALVPQGPALVQIECFSASATDARLKRLRDEIELLPCPPARGPVAFAIRADLAGGDPAQQHGFRVPFRDLLPGFQGSFDELIMRLVATGGAGVEAQSANKPTDSRPWASTSASGAEAEHPTKSTGRSGLRRLLISARRFVQRLFSPSKAASVAVPPSGGAVPGNQAPAAAPQTVVGQPSWPAQLSLESLTQVIALAPEYLPFYAARGGLLAEAGQFEDAVRDFDQVLLREPAQVNVLFDRGVCYLNLDRLQPALADFNAVLRWLPTSPRTLAARAEVYRRLEAWDAADADLTTAIEQDPYEARWRLHRSRFRAQLRRHDEARFDADVAVALDPNELDYYTYRGSLLAERAGSEEDLTRALADFQTAAAIVPNRPELHVACAELNLRLNRIDEALASCARALALDPEHGPAYGIRGMAEETRGGPPDAVIRDCTAAIDRGSGNARVYMNRASAHQRQGELHTALDDLDKAVDLSPEFANAWNFRGAIHGQLEMQEEARADFDRAIELAPGWSVPYLNRSIWFRQHDELNAALDDCSKAIDADPTEPRAYLVRAQCRLAAGDVDLARRDLDTAVERGGELPQTWCERGKFLAEHGDLEQARADLDRALAIAPDHREALFHRGNVLASLKELDAALVDLDRLTRLSPELMEAYAGRGRIWMLKGQPERARQEFDEIARHHPDQAESVRIHQQLVQIAVHFQEERFTEAIDAATALIDSLPDCEPAYRLRACAYWYSEQFVEAIDDFTWLIEREQSPGDLCSRGQAWAELGEFDRALEDLDRAVEMVDPSDTSPLRAFIQNGRGLALTGLERFREANAEFERSIVACPQNAWAQFNLGLSYFRTGDTTKAAACFRLSLELKSPRLTPRKRARARAYLDKMKEPS
jgi:tetratricopeptide (TPR) repeat protein